MDTPHITPAGTAPYTNADAFRLTIQQEQEKTMEAICDVIYSNSLFFENKSDHNRSIINSLRKKYFYSEEGNPFTESMEMAFIDSGRILEETIIAIIREYAEQIKEIADYNIKLISSVEHTSGNIECAEKMYLLIVGNFRASMKLITRNAENIINSCTRYINLNLTYNEKIAAGLTSHLELLRATHEKSGVDFSSWLSHWWKQNEKDAAA